MPFSPLSLRLLLVPNCRLVTASPQRHYRVNNQISITGLLYTRPLQPRRLQPPREASKPVTREKPDMAPPVSLNAELHACLLKRERRSHRESRRGFLGGDCAEFPVGLILSDWRFMIHHQLCKQGDEEYACSPDLPWRVVKGN